MDDIVKITKLRTSAIIKGIKENRFPNPRVFVGFESDEILRWLKSDIDNWIGHALYFEYTSKSNADDPDEELPGPVIV